MCIRDRYNDYERSTQSKEYSESKTYGINFRNDFHYDPFNFQIIADYEKGSIGMWKEVNIDSITHYSNIPNSDYDLFSLSGNVSLKLFDGSLVPSAFSKFSSYYTISGSRDFSDNPLSIGFDVVQS